MEDDSDLSSSSSSYSSSGEESVGEEEDEDSEEEAPRGTELRDREKRKRKRKLAGRRRELRSKYESVKDFNPEARSAQTEEIERIRRLELQRSLQAANASSVQRIASVGGNETEPSALLGRGPVFGNLAEDEKRERVVEAIVISSDSEEEEDRDVVRRGGDGGRGGVVESGREVKREEEEEERGGRYDVLGEEVGEQIVVNLGHPPDEEDVLLVPQVVRIIKPHQVGGVRFLFDNLIESLSRFHTSTGFGCVLAHSMGLGKTLQIISFIDIFFRYTPAQNVLCVVPVNTLQNWVIEFDKWLPDKEKEERKRNGTLGSSSKTSRAKNKRSQQNGRWPLQPSPNNASPLYNSLSSSVVTKDTVSVPTVTMDNSSQLFPGGVMSEADHQLLMSLVSDTSSQLPSLSHSPGEKLMSSLPGGLTPGNAVTLPSLSGPGSRPHTPNPSVTDSRSHTSSPSVPEVQYRTFKLFVLSESYRTMEARLRSIKQWRSEGGVLLIGYEMYRLLSLSVPSLGGNKMAIKRRKTTKSTGQTSQSSCVVDLDENEREMENLMEIQRALCVPGPDLVVCDEGHRIKNDATNISQALKKIQTRRRVVITGYPLQNNLLEYWCMVDFVRPKYLGTKQEFCDLFERPISNGQCVDSTPQDVRTMRYRSHVLHTLLKGFVLRRGHEILKSTLPAKFEHVLLVRPSPAQAVLYDYNMNTLQQGGTSTTAGPLKAFAVCTKIWNHPDIYYNEATKEHKKNPLLSWQDDVGLPKGLVPKTETNKVEWPTEALSMLPPYETGRLDNSPKMVVAMEIMDRSVQLGDKLLIFSQSLLTLSYIESLLVRRPIPIPHSAGPAGEVQYSGTMWSKNVNFCRLDGSTSSGDRDRLITGFNSPSNTDMWVFLLSTRAGCLGINLIGANRVIVLDVSWNPCYDAQAVCRVYRYGQTKPCHIYRLVCDGMMERKIYDRQISKQGMADRVVDELQPERHFTADEIITLMRPLAALPDPQDFSISSAHFLFDQVLYILCRHFGPLLTKLPFRHESLLLDSANEKMTDVEKLYAMRGFQQDWHARKRNIAPQVSSQRNAPISPQPRQGGVPSPVAPPTALPSQPSPSSSLCISPYSNTRVGLPSATSLPNYSLQSHSGSNIAPQQHGHSSIPSGSGDMGYGNFTPVHSDVICLDSDSEVDWNQGAPQSTSAASNMISSQATLLPGPKVLTVPISSTIAPAHSSLGSSIGPTHPSSGSTHFPTDHTSSGVGSPPLNAAVAQLMAFLTQREVVGGGGEGGSVSSGFLSSSTSSLTATSNSSSVAFNPNFALSSTSTLSSAGSQSGGLGQVQNIDGQSLAKQPIIQPGYTSSSNPITNSFATGANSGQYLGHSTTNSGQQTSVWDTMTSSIQPVPGSTTDIYSHLYPQHITSNPSNSLSMYSNLQSSTLLKTTSNSGVLVSPDPIRPSPISTVPLSNPAGSCSGPMVSLQHTNDDVSSLSSTLSSNTAAPVGMSQGHMTQSSSHMTQNSGHMTQTTSQRPLFSPPRLPPISREAPQAPVSHSPSTVPLSSSSFSSSHSTRPSGHPTQAVPSHSQISSSPPSCTSPSLPCSPSTVLSPSPPSQPPTPTTSIPLLSPVAAHFFQVSMSKSPKPSPSPGHTPTPSPSPSSHHLTSPPLRSPPTAVSPVPKKNPPSHSTTHSGFHSNNRDNSSLSGSYGNSCVILQ